MIQVLFNPINLADDAQAIFKKWLLVSTRMQRSLNEAILGGREAKFRTEVWGALKKFLLKHTFHGKCAYCEIDISAGFVGDAEHFRPKGAVTESVGDLLVPVVSPRGDHTGYFWIAYDWRNLLPSCQKCNSGKGKRTQFPIEGARAHSPADGSDFDQLNRFEKPLLLHPYDSTRNPKDYLVFSPDGAVIGRGKIGEMTIRVFDLNREELKEQRRFHMKSALNELLFRLQAAFDDIENLGAAINAIHTDLSAPSRQFSAAIWDAINIVRSKFGPG